MEIPILEEKSEIKPSNFLNNQSTLVTSGNILITNNSNKNLRTIKCLTPNPKVNLFNQGKSKGQQIQKMKIYLNNKDSVNLAPTQKNNKDKNTNSILHNSLKKQEPFKIIERRNPKKEEKNKSSTYKDKKTINANNNNLNKGNKENNTERENVNKKEEKEQKGEKGEKRKRGNSVPNNKVILDKKYMKNNDKEKSSSNIKTPIHRNEGTKKSNDSKKVLARSFIENSKDKETKIGENSSLNNNDMKFYQTASININKNKTLQMNNDNIMAKTSRRRSNIKKSNHNNVSNNKKQISLNKNFIPKTVDSNSKQKIEQMKNIHEMNVTSLLYLLTQYENFLQTQMEKFLNSYPFTKNSTHLLNNNNEHLDNNNTSPSNEFLLEIDSLTKSVKESIDKINSLTQIKETTYQIKKQNMFQIINQESEQRKTIYNQCFEGCIDNLIDIIDLLKAALPPINSNSNSNTFNNTTIKPNSNQILNKQCDNEDNKNENENDKSINENTDVENEIQTKVNMPKNLDFKVNKPKENNLKYQLYIERSTFILNSDYDNKADFSGVSKVVIGEIEPYKDIIDQDAGSGFKHKRSKSSFDLQNKLSKKQLNIYNGIQILGEEEQISDMEFKVDFSGSEENEYIEMINDEYDIDEYKMNDKTGKKGNHLIPYHISKISFCKVFDEANGKEKITQSYQDNIPSKRDNNELRKERSKIKKKKSSKKIFNTLKKKETYENNNLKIEKGEECKIF